MCFDFWISKLGAFAMPCQGADTVVVRGDTILEKPKVRKSDCRFDAPSTLGANFLDSKDAEHALAMLKQLQGRDHQAWSWWNLKKKTFVFRTVVFLPRTGFPVRPFSEEKRELWRMRWRRLVALVCPLVPKYLSLVLACKSISKCEDWNACWRFASTSKYLRKLRQWSRWNSNSKHSFATANYRHALLKLERVVHRVQDGKTFWCSEIWLWTILSPAYTFEFFQGFLGHMDLSTSEIWTYSTYFFVKEWSLSVQVCKVCKSRLGAQQSATQVFLVQLRNLTWDILVRGHLASLNNIQSKCEPCPTGCDINVLPLFKNHNAKQTCQQCLPFPCSLGKVITGMAISVGGSEDPVAIFVLWLQQRNRQSN